MDKRLSGSSSPPVSRPNRLGVLLVHGIGVQRPGDITLVASDALFAWLRRWLRAQGGDVAVDDASLIPSHDGTSARARFSCRASNGQPTVQWLLTESYWADAFYPPTLPELARWCWRVLLWAPVMYLLPWFQRSWRAHRLIESAIRNSQLTLQEKRLLLRIPDIARLAKTGLLDQKVIPADALKSIGSGQLSTAFGVLFKLPIVSIVGPLLALGFLALAVVAALIPSDSLRSAVRFIQRVFSDIIGDSYFFVASPVTRHAIFGRIQQDLNALLDECDEVVVIAHSQGAAVAHGALRHAIEHGWNPSRTSLITYGSGVRRLTSLEHAFGQTSRWNYYGLVGQVLLALQLFTIGMWLTNQVSGLIALTWFGSMVIVGGGLLVAATDTFEESADLLPLRWRDMFASHDPVPAGPAAVRDPDEPQPDSADIPQSGDRSMTFEHMLAIFITRVAETPADRFYRAQREVTNQRSLMFDHTSYWQSTDDFVAWVADDLLAAAGTPLHANDREWFEIASIRRAWRGSFLASCRAVSLVAALALLASPAFLISVGRTASSVELRFAAWLPDWASRPAILGPGSAAFVIGLFYLWAASGWYAWDSHEQDVFFARAPYATSSRYPKALLAGWVGIVTATTAAVFSTYWPAVFSEPSFWLTAVMMALTAIAVGRAVNGAGNAKVLSARIAALRVKILETRGATVPAV